MLFQLQSITKTYAAVTALNNLSVTVPAGAVGLLGPNGSGKTTLIRTLLGLITIDKGSGEILGKDFRRQQLTEALAAHGVPVTALELTVQPPPGAFPWRANQREMTL